MTKEEIAKVTEIRKRFYTLSDAEILAEHEAIQHVLVAMFTGMAPSQEAIEKAASLARFYLTLTDL